MFLSDLEADLHNKAIGISLGNGPPGGKQALASGGR
jgi:hypothetical protein